MKRFPFTAIFLASSLFTLYFSNSAIADTVSFWGDGTFTTPSYSKGGVMVTGSNDLRILNGGGVAIMGGAQDFYLDFDESVTFSFGSQITTDVTYAINIAANTDSAVHTPLTRDRTIDIFGESGVFLGNFNQTGTDNAVSSLVSNQPISSFTISMITDSTRINSVTFSASTVPLPAGAWLFLSALGGLASIRAKSA